MTAAPWVPVPGRPSTGVQRTTRTVAGTFLVVGVLGFLPGVTSDLGGIGVAGPGSSAALFGLLPVTVAGNVVHLLLGVAGLASVGVPARARWFLVWGGGLYALLCLRSIAVDGISASVSPGFVAPLWLAAAAGVALLAGGAAWSPAPGSGGRR